MSSLQAACAFCNRAQLDLLSENEAAFAIRDKYPVRRLHSLILPKRHIADTFELTQRELQAVFELAKGLRDGIARDDPDVGGFNFGSNNGRIAGQKIMHVHFHLIPRRPGDAEVPPARQ